MTRTELHPILHELQHPASSAIQLSALTALKNELVGHELRKRSWISRGIIPILSTLISAKVSQNGKRATREASTGDVIRDGRAVTTAEEACRLQAVVILGILAQGGPSLVVPILHSQILVQLISNLTTSECPQALTLAILKTLHSIADRLPPNSPDEWPVDRQLASLLYSREHVDGLSRIIGQTSHAAKVQQAVSLTISLICKTCTEERQKEALVDAGVLDALASRLASFAVAQGFVLPGVENHIREHGDPGTLPPPAAARARLAPTLRAIALLIELSNSRARSFLSSPAILAIFPRSLAEFSPSDVKKTPWGTSTYLSGSAVPRHSASNPIDSLLPLVPSTSTKLSAEQVNFPPLGSGGPMPRKRSSFQSPSFPAELAAQNNVSEDDESPVVAWLIYLVRAECGITRLMAARLLVALFSLGLTKKSRSSMFCMLLVPLLIRMLDKDYGDLGVSEPLEYDTLPVKLRIQEEAPSILANLVMDGQKLQKAAVDCHCIKKLSQMLKETFDPLPASAHSMWSPHKASDLRETLLSAESAVAERAPGTLARHVMKLREGILQALASIVAFDDDYKKEICAQGVVAYIIDSLKPYPSYQSESKATVVGLITGNAPSTLLAACGAARALTRSVSVLRTSLIDAGIGPPLFALLHHADIEVQIAATKAVSNLAVDFSPMKEAIIQQNVINTLCEHSHSANARLRLASLWALKHLVLNSNNELKIRVIRELGSDWIKQLIATDLSDIAPGTIIGVSPTFKAKDAMEDIMTFESGLRQERSKKDLHRARSSTASDEDATNKHTVEDDVAIQAEVLDLIRNLFCGDEAAEVIDYVMNEMGQNDFFEIILDRIRPRTMAGPTLKDTKTTPAASEIVTKVLVIILHIAASLPKFRSMIASQSNLLRQVCSLLSHSNRDVRVQCCWIVINLTYADDDSDRNGCRQRAQELDRLGYLSKLMAMAEDADLDVRERTKTAIDLIGAHVRH